jgi:hypothetical protein
VSLLRFFEWLADTPGSAALHESVYMYSVIESIHVLTLCLFFGLALMVDLRLMGVALRRVPASEVVDRFVPWMTAGFVVMIITGSLLFYAIPVRSYQNVFFRLKLLMLVAAGVNVWLFHSGEYRRIADWDVAVIPPRGAKVAGTVSLILWAAIVIAGRMIAYNWFDCDHTRSVVVEWAAGCQSRAASQAEDP